VKKVFKAKDVCLGRDDKTGQSDPFWHGPYVIRQKRVGPGWPVKQKQINNHNLSRIRWA